jgi:DNA-binding transcriptional regulator YdaS (Cro superfamily)
MSDPSPLRAYRTKAELSLERLAVRFGVNRSTLLRWEEGRVPAERVLDVERETGVSRHDLRPDIYPRLAMPPASRASEAVAP